MVGIAGASPSWQRRPVPRIGRAVRSAALLMLGFGIAALAVDDVQLRRAQPQETAATHRYMDGVVHRDPAQMWTAYSARARHERGDDRDRYINAMGQGMAPLEGSPNRYRLVARVPLDDGWSLLYYQVELRNTAGSPHMLFPLTTDKDGMVDDAANDSLHVPSPSAVAGR